MIIYVLVSELSSVTLWGLTPEQRLRRQLDEIKKELKVEVTDICWLDEVQEAPEHGQVLVLNGHFLFENRTIKGVISKFRSVLQCEKEIAAAFIEVENLKDVLDCMHSKSQNIPAGLNTISTRDLEAFDINLRRSTVPLLEPISLSRKNRLENKLYGNAYRGITDLITKFVWPRPANCPSSR